MVKGTVFNWHNKPITNGLYILTNYFKVKTTYLMLASRREKKSIAWCQWLGKISQDELS